MIKMKEIRVRMAADSHVKMRYDLHSRRKQTDKIKEQAKETTKIEPLIKAGCRIWRLFLNLTRDASRKTWNRTRLKTSSNCVKLPWPFILHLCFLAKFLTDIFLRHMFNLLHYYWYISRNSIIILIDIFFLF